MKIKWKASEKEWQKKNKKSPLKKKERMKNQGKKPKKIHN